MLKKRGEFLIDIEKQMPTATTSTSLTPSRQSNGDFGAPSLPIGGFNIRHRVQREGKCGNPLVQLAMQRVTCVEDATIFMAMALDVDLSIEACKLFRQKMNSQVSALLMNKIKVNEELLH